MAKKERKFKYYRKVWKEIKMMESLSKWDDHRIRVYYDPVTDIVFCGYMIGDKVFQIQDNRSTDGVIEVRDYKNRLSAHTITLDDFKNDLEMACLPLDMEEEAREVAAEIEAHDAWVESSARELCAILCRENEFEKAWHEQGLRFEQIVYGVADKLGVKLSGNHVDMRNFCSCCGAYIDPSAETYMANEDGDIICKACHDAQTRG